MPSNRNFVEVCEFNGEQYGRDANNCWYRRGQDNRWTPVVGRPDTPRSGLLRTNTTASVPRHDENYSASSSDQLAAGINRLGLSNQAQSSGSALQNTANFIGVRRQSGNQVNPNRASIHTDPELSRNNLEAHRRILSPPNNEQLPSGYIQRKNPKQYFTFGKVFSAVWTEEAGIHSDISGGSAFSQARYGWIHQKTRFFVVIRPGNNCCTAIPITTYGGRGCSKNVFKNDHGIIYTGSPPDPLPAELPGRNELPMQRVPIRVMPDHPTDKLLALSRVNYFKFCTVDHSAFVRHFGVVQNECRESLRQQTLNCWRRSDAGFQRAGSANSTILIPRVQDETPEEAQRRLRVQSHTGAADLNFQYQSHGAQARETVSPAEYRARWIAEYMRRTNCTRQSAEQAFLNAQNNQS